MNQPTREEFERLEEEQRLIREENKKIKKRLENVERQTEPIPATTRIEVASADVLNQLKSLEQGQQELKQDLTQELTTISNTWLDTLQEHYDEHKEALSDVKTVQSGHSKFFEEHGKRLAATATKDDVNNRFDKVEGDIAELKGLVIQLLQQKG